MFSHLILQIVLVCIFPGFEKIWSLIIDLKMSTAMGHPGGLIFIPMPQGPVSPNVSHASCDLQHGSFPLAHFDTFL